jgi:hypothetical protein
MQLLLQFSDFGFVPLDFFGCFSLLLDLQELRFGFRQLFSLSRNLASSASYVALVVVAVASWFGLG